MSQISSSSEKGLPTRSQNRTQRIVLTLIFFLIMLLGLWYVKWFPYYQKANLAISSHSIGASILGSNTGSPSFSLALQYAFVYFNAVWKAAVLGVLLGSLLQVLLPTDWLIRLLGKTAFGSTVVAGIAAVPGMMCTCCAAPIAIGMRKKRVSVGASLAFWLGNPILNPATLVFMTFVLSWKFTLLRLIFGIILTFGVSYLANRFVPEVNTKNIEQIIKEEETKEAEKRKNGLFVEWLKSIAGMLLYIVPTYILSVLLMGAFRVWLFPHLGSALTNSFIVVIVFAVAGMLFVIPTAAEIPIIQTLMSLGMGGGPAGALLITLPTVSLPSLLMLARSFPKKVLFFVAASVVVLGIVAGLLGMFLL